MNELVEEILDLLWEENCSDYPEFCTREPGAITVAYPQEHPEFSSPEFRRYAGRTFKITVEELT